MYELQPAETKSISVSMSTTNGSTTGRSVATRPVCGLQRPGQVAAAFALLGLLLGCVGTGEGVPVPPSVEEGAAPQNTDEILGLLDEKCAGCHFGSAAPKGLSLEPAQALGHLVDIRSVEAPELLRIEPTRSDRSYFVVKLAATDPRRVGGRMPLIGKKLTGKQLRVLKRWIDAGATAGWLASETDLGSTDDLGAQTGDGGSPR